MRYLVSYDVDTPGKDYQKLWNELERLGGKRVLLSEWIVRNDATPAVMRDHFRQFIDANDRLLVSELTDNWASWNLMFDPNRL